MREPAECLAPSRAAAMACGCSGVWLHHHPLCIDADHKLELCCPLEHLLLRHLRAAQ